MNIRTFFVDLAPIADPALVLPTIALAPGLQQSGTRTVREMVKACLHPAPTLLVPDTGEQLPPAAPACGFRPGHAGINNP